MVGVFCGEGGYLGIGIGGCGVAETMVVGSRGGIVCFGGGYLGFGLGKIMFERKNNVEDEEEGEEDEAEEEEKEKEKGEGNSSLSKSLLDLAPPNHSLLIQLNKTIVTIHYLGQLLSLSLSQHFTKPSLIFHFCVDFVLQFEPNRRYNRNFKNVCSNVRPCQNLFVFSSLINTKLLMYSSFSVSVLIQ